MREGLEALGDAVRHAFALRLGHHGRREGLEAGLHALGRVFVLEAASHALEGKRLGLVLGAQLV